MRLSSSLPSTMETWIALWELLFQKNSWRICLGNDYAVSLLVSFMVVLRSSRVELRVSSNVELHFTTRAPYPLLVAEILDRLHPLIWMPSAKSRYRCVSHSRVLIVFLKSICARREPWDYTYTPANHFKAPGPSCTTQDLWRSSRNAGMRLGQSRMIFNNADRQLIHNMLSPCPVLFRSHLGRYRLNLCFDFS